MSSLSVESSYTYTQVLPMHPGYALGCVIHETDYLIPYYNAFLSELSDIYDKRKKEQDEFTAAPEFKDLIKEKQQAKKIAFAVELSRIAQKIENVTKEFEKKCSKPGEIMIQKALPFDENKIKIINREVSFESERLKSLEFIGKGEVLRRVENFVKNLFLNDVPKSILPAGTIEGISKDIQGILESEGRVVIVGSIITLARVKRLDPLIIPKNATIDNDLQTNVAKYLVLYETVLGGVFLGIGKAFKSATELPSKNEVNPNLLSSLTTVSFISQGAIPKLDSKIENVNLWEVYCNWKETLTTDNKCGYPLGFKVRALKDVLEENRKYYEQD